MSFNLKKELKVTVNKNNMERPAEKPLKKLPRPSRPLLKTQQGLTLQHPLGSAGVLGADAPCCQGTPSKNPTTAGAHTVLLPEILHRLL